MTSMDFYKRKELAVKWIDSRLESAFRSDQALSISRQLYDCPPHLCLKKTIMERIEGAVAFKRFMQDGDLLIPLRNTLTPKEQEILQPEKEEGGNLP